MEPGGGRRAGAGAGAARAGAASGRTPGRTHTAATTWPRAGCAGGRGADGRGG
jgi:hypothetical protein